MNICKRRKDLIILILIDDYITISLINIKIMELSMFTAISDIEFD